MSHEPPLPEAAVSPYPLQPPPAPEPHPVPEANGSAGTDEASGDQSWAERARGAFDLAKEHKVALGAAAGIGSAALLAALMFARRAKSDSGKAARGTSRREPREA
jgi:hypothetical protein